MLNSGAFTVCPTLATDIEMGGNVAKSEFKDALSKVAIPCGGGTTAATLPAAKEHPANLQLSGAPLGEIVSCLETLGVGDRSGRIREKGCAYSYIGREKISVIPIFACVFLPKRCLTAGWPRSDSEHLVASVSAEFRATFIHWNGRLDYSFTNIWMGAGICVNPIHHCSPAMPAMADLAENGRDFGPINNRFTGLIKRYPLVGERQSMWPTMNEVNCSSYST